MQSSFSPFKKLSGTPSGNVSAVLLPSASTFTCTGTSSVSVPSAVRISAVRISAVTLPVSENVQSNSPVESFSSTRRLPFQ